MYRYGCRCDDCRRAQTERFRAYAARRRAAGRPVEYRRRTIGADCAHCGESFEIRVGDKRRFCSIGCANESMYGLSRSQELVHVGPIPARPKPTFKLRPIAGPRRIFVQGCCSWCDEPFTAITLTGAAKFCSRHCRARLRSRAQGRFVVKPKRRIRIYERDAWVCQICHEPTSLEWDAEDPWSPTLDHIEPQSATLIPDHSDTNLRLVHALCNSFRGDGALSDNEVRALVFERRRVDVPA